MLHSFNSQFTLGHKLPEWDEDMVKNEPMIFSGTPLFAWKNGGPITQAFLAACFGIPLADYAEFKLRDSQAGNYCFDSRVHMLMPGWFPCIPGWHHDDVPRSRPDRQPNYATPEYRSKHILALVNGDICPTEFAVGLADDYEDTPVGCPDPVYKRWHERVEDDIFLGMLNRVPVPSNQLVHFDCNSFHQGTRAVKRGWRWFGRLTWDAGYPTHRQQRNEIRRQTQVYLERPMEGW